MILLIILIIFAFIEDFLAFLIFTIYLMLLLRIFMWIWALLAKDCNSIIEVTWQGLTNEETVTHL